MANSNTTADHLPEFRPASPPSTPPQSTPLRLLGFLTGDTVEVQGDAGELHFSVQLNVRRKELHSGGVFVPPEPNQSDVGDAFDCRMQSLSPSSSSVSHTPENQYDDNADADESLSSPPPSRRHIVTRLRSGVLSPVKYYGVSNVDSSRRRREEAVTPVSRRKTKGDNVFDKMLKRRNFPVRPCNSYAFFLTENWGASAARCSSFGETNKRLSKQWFKLSPDKRKEYEDLASKDNARYKRQCILLRNDDEEGSGLPTD